MEVRLAWYPTTNLDEAKKFYGESLGLKQVFEMDGPSSVTHRWRPESFDIVWRGKSICNREGD